MTTHNTTCTFACAPTSIEALRTFLRDLASDGDVVMFRIIPGHLLNLRCMTTNEQAKEYTLQLLAPTMTAQDVYSTFARNY
jgi:hypothetical protein